MKRLLAAVAAIAFAGTAAQAEIKIGSVLSVSGPASFLGDPEKRTLDMGVDEINATADWLAAADAMVLMSASEGLANAWIEALANDVFLRIDAVRFEYAIGHDLGRAVRRACAGRADDRAAAAQAVDRRTAGGVAARPSRAGSPAVRRPGRARGWPGGPGSPSGGPPHSPDGSTGHGARLGRARSESRSRSTAQGSVTRARGSPRTAPRCTGLPARAGDCVPAPGR